MSIRPLDMQVMIPRIQDVAKITHLDQQKGQVQQQQIADTLGKGTLQQGKTVTSSEEDEKAKNEQDAKDEGKTAYYRDPRDKKQQEQQQEQQENTSRHKIDIKV
ncbi:MAG: hypothetical protein PF505_12680 [Vallitaleaceae bacterium]|jgi:hypothetical protein|nr:hypothetical protein [Vallitaleaceae bacterium]